MPINENAIIEDYIKNEMSTAEIAKKYNFNRSVVKRILKEKGLIRTMSDAADLAVRKGKKPMLLENLLKSRETNRFNPRKVNYGERNGKWVPIGTMKKHHGQDYFVVKVANNKWKYVHHVNAEAKIGRPLMKSECVHHIDFEKDNNDASNLEVMPRNEHFKMHSTIEKLLAKLYKEGLIYFDGRNYQIKRGEI